MDNSAKSDIKSSFPPMSNEYAGWRHIRANYDATAEIMECNNPFKIKIINSLESSSMKSSITELFAKSLPESNFTELSLYKKSFSELFNYIHNIHLQILIIAYTQFYRNLESTESQLKKYKVIIQQYTKIIKQFNAKNKTQSSIFRNINVNIATESSKSDNESKNDQDKKKEIIDETPPSVKLFPMKSSLTESSYIIKYYNMIIKSFNIHIANISRNLTSDVSKIEENVCNICKYNTDFKHFIAQYKTHIQIIRGIIPDIITESNKSNNESKEQDTKKEIIDETFSVLNLPFTSRNNQTKNMKMKECTTNIHSISNSSLDNQTETINDEGFMNTTEFASKFKYKKELVLRTSVIARVKAIIFVILTLRINKIIIIIKKFIPSKLITDKTRKDKKPGNIQATRNEIYRKYSLLCFTILLISFLFTSLFLLCFNFGLSHIDQNDKCTDIFASDIVELEKEILDHDRTVQILTEYLQRDTPLLKVVALVGGTSVDKSYTVDIIKKRLHKTNDFSHPNFVVLENLRAEHSIDVINFVKMYEEAYGIGQFTILAVFKIEHFDDDSTYSIDMNRTINIIKDSFIEANIISKLIPFEPLSEDILEKYITNTAENIRQTFSREQINYIKRCLIEVNTNCKKSL